MTIRPLLTLPLAITCVTPAFAQVYTFEGQEFVEPWPSELSSSAPFGRTSSGELTGDGVFDAVILDGTRAVLLVDPESAFAPIEIPLVVNDACVVNAHCTDGRGAVATVGAGGLNLCNYVSSSGTIEVHPSGLSAWGGAKRVCAAYLDTNASLDLVGVASDGRTVLLAKSNGVSFSFNALTSFLAASDVRDVVPLQWIAGGPQELALLTNTGVFVHDVNGTMLASFASVLPGGVIARIAQQGKSTDRLTWVTTYAPTAQQWLFTLSPSGVDGQIDVGGLDVVAATGSDFDRDGDDDLLLSHRFNYDLVYLGNQRSTASPNAVSFTLSTGGSRIFPAGPPNTSAPENLAWPAVADFDSDGDADVVFPCERNQEIRYLRGDWVDEQTQRASVASASYDVPTNRLTLQLTAPAVAPPGNKLAIDVWYQPSSTAAVQRLGVDRVIQSLPTSWPANIVVDLPGSSTSPQAIYWVEVHAITETTAGLVTSSDPLLVAAFTRDAAAVQLMTSDGGSTGNVAAAVCGGQPNSGATVLTRKRLKRFATNATPISCQP